MAKGRKLEVNKFSGKAMKLYAVGAAKLAWDLYSFLECKINKWRRWLAPYINQNEKFPIPFDIFQLLNSQEKYQRQMLAKIMEECN